jgi:hypothetical protein
MAVSVTGATTQDNGKFDKATHVKVIDGHLDVRGVDSRGNEITIAVYAPERWRMAEVTEPANPV